MTPEDRALARRALEEGNLSIHQVQEVKAACAKSGRTFLEEATDRGWLGAPAEGAPAKGAPPGPPRKTLPPWIFPALLGAALVIFAGLLAATLSFLRERSDRDDALHEETAQSRMDAERLSRLARADYERRALQERQTQAAEALSKARRALAEVESRRPPLPESERRSLLVEASLGFTQYLDAHSGDSQVYVERARAFELRGNFDKAVDDLEMALSLRKDLGPALAERLAELKKLARRTP